MSGLHGHVNVDQFRELAGKSSRLDPKLKAALRKRIRAAAMVAAQDVRQTVQQEPLSGGSSGQSTGLRDEIAAGIKVTIATGKTAGVIISSTARSAAHPRSVVVGYGARNGWRHPLYGDKDFWFQQSGRPYFKPVIDKHRSEVTAAVRQAMTEAAQSLK